MKSNLPDVEVQKPFNLTDWARARASVVIDPIVTFLARYRLSPDALTVAGMLFHFFVAWLIGTGNMVWAGVAVMFVAPLDALDGALARKTGKDKGGFGAFLDSTLDRVAEIILFGGFIYYFVQNDNTLMLAVSYLAVTGSLMVSYARGRAEGLGFDGKVGLMGRFERYIILTFFLLINQPIISLFILAGLTYITVFQRGLHVWRQARERVQNGR